ncbi:MAG TPA: hypothetical protein VEA18_03330, partial [Candidatus Kapabacteria bacterium]|nr:hypothetical protein [Candidatus Kapabacteria bacterium]
MKNTVIIAMLCACIGACTSAVATEPECVFTKEKPLVTTGASFAYGTKTCKGTGHPVLFYREQSTEKTVQCFFIDLISRGGENYDIVCTDRVLRYEKGKLKRQPAFSFSRLHLPERRPRDTARFIARAYPLLDAENALSGQLVLAGEVWRIAPVPDKRPCTVTITAYLNEVLV